MFHVKDGLFFERVASRDGSGNPIPGVQFGSVRMIKRDLEQDGHPITFEQVMTVEEWASVVSSMTIIGEGGPGLWAAIVALQKGQ